MFVSTPPADNVLADLLTLLKDPTASAANIQALQAATADYLAASTKNAAETATLTQLQNDLVTREDAVSIREAVVTDREQAVSVLEQMYNKKLQQLKSIVD